MKTKCFLFRLATCALISLVSSCVSGAPKDLKIERLSLIKISSETENEIGYGRYLSDDGRFYRLTLKLSTSADLVRLAEKYLVRTHAYFCDRPDSLAFIDIPGLYWNGMDVNSWGILNKYGSSEVPQDALAKEPEYLTVLSIDKFENQPATRYQTAIENDRNLYSLLLSTYYPESEGPTTKSPESDRGKYEAYDLVAYPEDICVVIEGRTMVRGGFRSNIVKVNKELINEILESLRTKGLKN